MTRTADTAADRAAHGAGGGAGWTLAVAFVALAACAGLLAITRWGIGTSPDSAHYIKAARTIAAEGTAGAAEALRHYAPLYPLLLTAGASFGYDVVEWARWLNAVVFAFTVLAAGLIVGRATPRAPWLGVAASVLVAASVPSLGVHSVALSEPVFLLLTLAGFSLLARHLEMPSAGTLVAAGAVLGLVVFARYAGAACVLAGALAVLVFGKGSFAARARDAVLVGVVSALPLLAWKVSQASAAAGAAREFAFHPLGRSQAWQAIYTVAGWLLVPPSAPNAMRLGVLGAVTAALVLAAAARWRRGAATPPVIAVLALFVPVYAAFLAVSLSFFDAATPLDDRILLPVFVAGLVVSLNLCGDAVASRRPLAVAAACGAILIVTVGQVAGAASAAAAGYERGLGFSSTKWRQSPTLAQVGELVPGALVYSNVPEAIYLRTGRDARPLPRRTIQVVRRPNEGFERELAEVGSTLRERCGVVVYFRDVTDNSSIVPARMLEDGLSLRAGWSGDDGAILEVPGCAR